MGRSIAKWTTAAAAAALFSLPAMAGAQSTGSTQAPGQPPEMSSQAPSPAQQGDAEAAKRHLTAARDTLSQMTQLPEAAQLTGDARTQISELISNFNALITTTVDWPSAYAKVEANLANLLGPAGSVDEPRPSASGTEGAVGTSGTAAALPGEVRARLVEFRKHLEQFEQAAGGTRASGAESTPAASTPAPSASGAESGSSAAGTAAGSATTTGSTMPASSSINRDEALQHITAIEALLGGSSAATSPAAGQTASESAEPLALDSAKMQQLRSHLAELRRILGQ